MTTQHNLFNLKNTLKAGFALASLFMAFHLSAAPLSIAN